MVRTAAVVSLALIMLAGCQTGPNVKAPPSILDASFRIPDDEGVVTSINFERVTLDGAHVYKISKIVESFTTGSHLTTPLAHWKGRYVHIGLDGKKAAVWIAGIGVVAKVQPPYVAYTGVFDRVKQGRAIFTDGTALKLGPGVTPPPHGQRSLVILDPEKKFALSISETSS